MPLIQFKKIWTPLELFGIELYKSEEQRGLYIKRRKKPIRRLL